MSAPFLSIVIPAYNEAARLPSTVPHLKEFLSQQTFTWEIILVDDGSADNTAKILYDFFETDQIQTLKNETNRGKGYSTRRGVKAARGEVILLTDADFSTPMEDFFKLHPYLEQGYDIAIGSRSLAESNVTIHQAWYRENMGRTFNKCVQLITLKGFIDTQCGFKVFSRQVGAPLFEKMTIDRFSFDVEFLYLARKAGWKVIEVPVEWHNVLESRVRILHDSPQMLFDLFRIRINDWLGKYE